MATAQEARVATSAHDFFEQYVNADGDTLYGVDGSGKIYQATANTRPAGIATPRCDGFLRMVISGVKVKLPYYFDN